MSEGRNIYIYIFFFRYVNRRLLRFFDVLVKEGGVLLFFFFFFAQLKDKCER